MNQIAKKNDFRDRVTTMAKGLLAGQVSKQDMDKAAGRISLAFAAAATAARDPSYLYKCAPASIARCVALSAQMDIVPSTGAGSLAYLVPRAVRRGEPPQLNLQFSHRGLAALAMRCGIMMLTVPIGEGDEITVTETGEVKVTGRDLDNPPMDWESLRGVMLLIKDRKTGSLLSSNFVPKVIIEKRRANSDSFKSGFGPWVDWPVEMSMKTAMHYGVARGWCVLDDAAVAKAIDQDIQGDLPAAIQETQEHAEENPLLSAVTQATEELPESEPVADQDEENTIDATE